MSTKINSEATEGQSSPSVWQNILDQEEVIRWQGRPDPTVIWNWSHYVTLVFGLALSGFALIWMILAAQEGGWFWMFGLIFFVFGISIMIGPPYWRPYLRSKSWYVLTNKRALIATDMPILGRKINSYPITPQTPLELDKKYGSSVYFATRTERSTRGSYKVKIGFELLDDAPQVYNLMSEIQKETA